MAELRYNRMVAAALADAMAEDRSVIVLGEDIGGGGVYGATRGLKERFGPDRVLDTPISEATFMGAAVGAALSGLKPVVEISFMDFLTFAMDPLVNQAAKMRFMFGGQGSVPLVVRAPHGGGVSGGAQHSQCLEAWFAHVPGLKLVCPADPPSAYGLLRSAIRDPDPVIVIEHKALYAARIEGPENPPILPIGKAHIARPGRDLTIVTYGAMLRHVNKAADGLAAEGVEAEIIDLRSLQPWDEPTVLESLTRTHRLVVAHEAVEAFGIGAEIAARMADIGFDELDAPIVRVGAPFMPSPLARELENTYLPDADRVIAAAKRVLE
ncbi:MAG TPA: alpha-ketoacid dehydrogenase subunit beta [Alphaproteobacteria bacterium]|nr:alpha-ketoacid dehydrogenase subunit beta [Alphaproteobacteria bacterium]